MTENNELREKYLPLIDTGLFSARQFFELCRDIPMSRGVTEINLDGPNNDESGIQINVRLRITDDDNRVSIAFIRDIDDAEERWSLYSAPDRYNPRKFKTAFSFSPAVQSSIVAGEVSKTDLGWLHGSDLHIDQRGILKMAETIWRAELNTP